MNINMLKKDIKYLLKNPVFYLGIAIVICILVFTLSPYLDLYKNVRDIKDLHYLHDKLYQQKSDGMRHLKGIQPENVEKCKNCKVNMFCWTCLEDLELHLSDEETFQQRCNNKRKILYSILWGKDPEV